MATFTRNNDFAKHLANKIFDLDTDVIRWVLSNTAPTASGTLVLTDITQIATGGGYTQMTDGAGGILATFSALAQATAAVNVATTGNVLTATGAVGTFRYVILVDDTPTSPANPVLGWIDHGVAITMANTDTYTIPSGNILVIG
jgi:hypothetical protein